jgi:hypothetical protein
MSAPLVPSPLDHLRQRRFAFYPPIRPFHIHRNEWLLGTGTWAEVQVINAHSGVELWIPRSYVRGVSSKTGLIPVVELVEDFESQSGNLAQRKRRIIEMPLRTDSEICSRKIAQPRAESEPGNVVAIRLERQGAFSARISKPLFGVIALGVLAAVLASFLRP